MTAGSKSEQPEWPLGDWFVDRASPADLIAYERREVLVRGRTPFQQYEVFRSDLWGLVLILDGRLQSAEHDEFIYHEALVQPAMAAHPDPRRVLILGGGEGATLREVLRHPGVAQVVMVDIDGELVEICKKWLPTLHAGAFEDTRTRLIIADGREWLESQSDAAFDVIVMDLPEPLEEGPARLLFTRQMYALVRRKLAPQGLVAVQSGSAGVAGRLMPDIFCTLRTVYPRVLPYVAFVSSYMDLYGFHLAGGRDFAWPSAAEIEARLAGRGLDGLKWFGQDYAPCISHLPVYLRERLEKEGRLLTDDQPFGPRPGERLFF